MFLCAIIHIARINDRWYSTGQTLVLNNRSQTLSITKRMDLSKIFHYLPSRRKPSFIWRHFSNATQCALTRQKHTFTRPNNAPILYRSLSHVRHCCRCRRNINCGRDLHALTPLSRVTINHRYSWRHCRVW